MSKSARPVKVPAKLKGGELGDEIGTVTRSVPFAEVVFVDDGVQKKYTPLPGELLGFSDDAPLKLQNLAIGMCVWAAYADTHYEAVVISLSDGNDVKKMSDDQVAACINRSNRDGKTAGNKDVIKKENNETSKEKVIKQSLKKEQAKANGKEVQQKRKLTEWADQQCGQGAKRSRKKHTGEPNNLNASEILQFLDEEQKIEKLSQNNQAFGTADASNHSRGTYEKENDTDNSEMRASCDKLQTSTLNSVCASETQTNNFKKQEQMGATSHENPNIVSTPTLIKSHTLLETKATDTSVEVDTRPAVLRTDKLDEILAPEFISQQPSSPGSPFYTDATCVPTKMLHEGEARTYSTPKPAQNWIAKENNELTSNIFKNTWQILQVPETPLLKNDSPTLLRTPPEVVDAFRLLTTPAAQDYMQMVIRSDTRKEFYVNEGHHPSKSSIRDNVSGSQVTNFLDKPTSSEWSYHISRSAIRRLCDSFLSMLEGDTLPALPQNTKNHEQVKTPVRRSPRKKLAYSESGKKSQRGRSECQSPQWQQTDCEEKKVKLLASSSVEVDAENLRRITRRARKESNPGAYIARKLMALLFTTEEMARSKGQGIGKGHKSGDIRPPLDKEKIAALKGYCHVWCSSKGYKEASEKEINSVITETVSYSRRKVKLSSI